MASFQKSICFLMAFFITTLISSTHAYTFQVGGKHGWTLHPSESYNTWSGRLRFLINDTLHFKYDGGSDSVLVVSKSDYDGCNANNPIIKMDGGDSMFKLDRSGPFYFITGNKSNCDQGQKLIVVVLALRNRSPPPPAATPPSPSTLPPSPAATPVLPPSIVSPPSTAVSASPVFSPSISPVSPPSTVGSPESSPAGAPILTPPASSPGGGSANSPGGGSADTPGGESADSPGGGSADSPGGGTADSPGGGGGKPPGGNSPGANVSTSARSVATPPVSGIIIASFVTMMFGLWGIN